MPRSVFLLSAFLALFFLSQLALSNRLQHSEEQPRGADARKSSDVEVDVAPQQRPWLLGERPVWFKGEWNLEAKGVPPGIDVGADYSGDKSRAKTGRKAIWGYASDMKYLCMAIYNFKVLHDHYNLTSCEYIITISFEVGAEITESKELAFINFKKHESFYQITGYSNHVYQFAMDKLIAFKAVEYDQVVYFDSDSVVLRSFDTLLQAHPFDVPFAAPLGYWEGDNCFTSAFYTLVPDREIYREMYELMFRLPLVPTDMYVLNQYFQFQLPSGPGGTMYYTKDMLLWPYFYFCLSYGEDRKYYNGKWKLTWPKPACTKSYVLHFTGGGKPWSGRSGSLPAEEQELYAHLNSYRDQCVAGKFAVDSAEYDRIRKALNGQN